MIRFLFMAAFFAAGCSKQDGTGNEEDGINWPQQHPVPVVHGTSTFTLSATEDYVNAMGNMMAPMPSFPAIKVKAGFVRGYVADLNGKPLKGAHIGARVTLDGGSYSNASAETDANGYYEFKVPSGAAHFYAAGYTIDYGEGRAAVALYPADGKIENFTSGNGMVKNFTMLAYGIADKDKISQRPKDEANYFGGALYISYIVDDPDDIYTTPGQLPYNAEIEVTLTPEGASLYGDDKTFVINKKAGAGNFTITNIPVGAYKISAKLKDSRQLKMKATGTYGTAYPFFGLKPAEATGSAKVLFTPLFNSQQATVVPNLGNWRAVQIKFELP